MASGRGNPSRHIPTLPCLLRGGPEKGPLHLPKKWLERKKQHQPSKNRRQALISVGGGILLEKKQQFTAGHSESNIGKSSKRVPLYRSFPAKSACQSETPHQEGASAPSLQDPEHAPRGLEHEEIVSPQNTETKMDTEPLTGGPNLKYRRKMRVPVKSQTLQRVGRRYGQHQGTQPNSSTGQGEGEGLNKKKRVEMKFPFEPATGWPQKKKGFTRLKKTEA